jgi:hypothetical protein
MPTRRSRLALASAEDSASPHASIASIMQRVMIQLEPALAEQAKRAAHERGVSFPQFVREALVRELTLSGAPSQPLSCVGLISSGGRARSGLYEPDAWR